MSRILVVEDEKIIRQAVKRLLERQGHEIFEADSLHVAKELTFSDYDMIISDLRLPGGNGTELIELAGEVPVLIMTSYASLRSAVDAMKLGAVDYIAKPFDHEEMLLTVERILKQRNLSRTNEVLQHEIEKEYPVTGIIGSSQLMQNLFTKISKVAPTDATVLIQGESGTGKELVARALHTQSRRKDAPMISVNCAAIPESLIESELFGHEKGAFTGAATLRLGLVEAADGGTLFLDEIGELPLEAQARLLRVLQEGEIRRVGSVQSRKVDVRLIAATHRNLKELASKAEFREDLYYRLNVLELHLPPLRARGKDVIELAEFMLLRSCEKMNRSIMLLTDASRQAILQYQWPGNVRELENAIERAVILADGNDITPENMAIDFSPDQYVPQTLKENLLEPETTSSNEANQGDLSLDDYFMHFVLENEDGMNETDLARKLGVSRKCLWERRQRLGIPRKKATKSS
ncbi:MAG: sigma-54-dependent Fis family transcriptional regulator [Oleispira antarctica]|nr:sigma-54-dependent Fis family transcriptional regulator [Oleispira antarctica]MBQ0791661.1 sigma-54-dependent Fis family transcriptional regulator [Oleispira antarctica]